MVVEPGAGVVVGHIANASSTALLSSVLDCGENTVGAGRGRGVTDEALITLDRLSLYLAEV